MPMTVFLRPRRWALAGLATVVLGCLGLACGAGVAAANERDSGFSAGFSTNTHLGEGGSFSAGVFLSGTEYHGQAVMSVARPTFQYVRHHCPIWVYANVMSGYPDAAKNGIVLRGKKIPPNTAANPLSYSVPRYSWTIGNQDQFCAAVGGWYPHEYRVLTPTTETAHGGSYVDDSQNMEANGTEMQGMFIFAKRRSSR
jgi:hypothetical protein